MIPVEQFPLFSTVEGSCAESQSGLTVVGLWDGQWQGSLWTHENFSTSSLQSCAKHAVQLVSEDQAMMNFGCHNVAPREESNLYTKRRALATA